jgi:hypothetical protein
MSRDGRHPTAASPAVRLRAPLGEGGAVPEAKVASRDPFSACRGSLPGPLSLVWTGGRPPARTGRAFARFRGMSLPSGSTRPKLKLRQVEMIDKRIDYDFGGNRTGRADFPSTRVAAAGATVPTIS